VSAPVKVNGFPVVEPLAPDARSCLVLLGPAGDWLVVTLGAEGVEVGTYGDAPSVGVHGAIRDAALLAVGAAYADSDTLRTLWETLQ
jgi:hypothetical protein